VSDDDAVLALCDLGGAADFETGQGCDGAEAIFDPVYGAPEQFERVGGGGGGFTVGGLFGRGGRPGEGTLTATGVVPHPGFDAFGIGMCLLRLGVPSLHAPGAVKRARAAMEAAKERADAGQVRSIQTFFTHSIARFQHLIAWVPFN